MIKEAFGFGSTVEEAKEDALLKLGARVDEDVQIEIVAMPKKKVFGVFGGAQAQIRVFVERPDEKLKKAKKPNGKKAENRPVPKKEEKKAVTVKKEETQEKQEAPIEQKEINAVDASQIPADSKAGKAIAYLNNILSGLGCENTSIKADVSENGAVIILEGEGLGALIGRRGETLDALQHLVSLAAKGGGSYFKITLNVGDYREKRERTLIDLAKRISEQVLRTSRSRTLEPMSPYERRIIHTTVQGIEGVVSSSVGEGDNRRVVIYVEGGEMRMSRSNDRRRGDKNRKKTNTVASTPSREPKRDSDIPLYGKIQSSAADSE